MKSTKRWLAAALVATFVLGGARVGRAMEYDSSKNPHEVTLKLYLNQDQWVLPHETWSNFFVQARNTVWDYTDHQCSIKRIEVYRRSSPAKVDIRASGTRKSGANKKDRTWPNSFIYPNSKQPWMFLPSDMKGIKGQEHEGHVIAHEMGHGIFGVYDEYAILCLYNTDPSNDYIWNALKVPKNGKDSKPFVPNFDWYLNYGKIYAHTPSFHTFNEYFGRSALEWYKDVFKDCSYTWPAKFQKEGPHTIMNDDTNWFEMSIPSRGSDPASWSGREHFGPWKGSLQLEKKTYSDVLFMTYQYAEQGHSCWTTMEKKRGLAYGTGTGTQPDFEWRLMDGSPVVVLVIDSSGSMSWDGKWEKALEAARNAVGMAWQGDYVGVITFASSPRTRQSPIMVEDKATRSSIQSKISGSASGGTDIDAALRKALSDLASVRTESTGPECIILLSDGQSSVADATLWALKARHVTVHTVAYGSDADKVLLRRIAEATGGRMVEENVPNWRARKSAGAQSRALSTSGNLSQFFAELYAEGRESEQTAKLEGVASGMPIEQEIVVDSFGDIDLTVNLYWERGDMDVALVKPDGTVIERAVAEAAESDLDGGKETDTAFIRVNNPETGSWKVRVVPAAGSGEQAYLATVSCTGRDNMRMYAETSGDSLTWPAPLVVSASFAGAVPAITGAMVTAVATCPDGTEVPFELNDNGVNGDEEAGDGVYAAEFKGFTEDGEYRFDVEGKNISGMTTWQGASPSLGGELPDPEPVEPFVRRKSLTVQYDGLPEFINATRYTGTEFASWTLNRNTGAMTGSLVVSNQPTSRKTLIAPFWYAVTETVNVTLAKVDGYTDDGDPYVNITDKVEAALMAKYGRKSMAPGEWVTIDGVEVYSRDRSIPDMTALWSLWADPPAGAERRIDSYDRDSDGVLDDEEILLAVEHWEALDMDDEALLKRIALWKQGEE